MAKAELKTRPTASSVKDFLDAIPDEGVRKDCRALSRLMRKVTGAAPTMWGSSLVGFGSYHYKYDSGREGDWPLTGFSPRKQNLTVYVMTGFAPHASLMKKLGKYKTGKGCLYFRRLDDIDVPTLERILRDSVRVKKAAR